MQGKRVVTDGPYAETREQIGGYTIIDADNLDEALAIAGAFVKTTGDSKATLEVRPIVDLSKARCVQGSGSVMIVVAGHLRVAPTQRDRVLGLSREAVVLARATPGCLDFVVAAELVDAARVNVFERWSDRASLMAFRQSGPDNELGPLIPEYIVKEFEVVVPGLP
jgi:quinol monooxygenase YgiN